MAKLRLLLIFLLSISCILLTSCAGGEAQTDDFTDEFIAFAAAHGSNSASTVLVSPDGYQFTLENGRLTIVSNIKAEPNDSIDNAEVWRSNDEWYVDSLRVGDVNCDGITDFAFVVWKSYSFGEDHPARITNEDATVRCHLFVYSIKDDRVKALWCSSNLPRPIYSFELYMDGIQTPTLSGARLVTQEGDYTEDFSQTVSIGYEYEWNGWGFSPVTPPPGFSG